MVDSVVIFARMVSTIFFASSICVLQIFFPAVALTFLRLQFKMERNNIFWKGQQEKVDKLQKKWYKDVVSKEKKVYS